MASRRTVKLWLFVWAVLTYITHSKAFGLWLYNTCLFCGRARNVGMWLAAKMVGRGKCPRPGGFQLFSMSAASFIRHFMTFEESAFPCCLQLLFSLLHLPFSHSQPGRSCWICALRASQDVAIEKANVGKARAWLYVHNSKSVSAHRLRIPQCLS